VIQLPTHDRQGNHTTAHGHSLQLGFHRPACTRGRTHSSRNPLPDQQNRPGGYTYLLPLGLLIGCLVVLLWLVLSLFDILLSCFMGMFTFIRYKYYPLCYNYCQYLLAAISDLLVPNEEKETVDLPFPTHGKAPEPVNLTRLSKREIDTLTDIILRRIQKHIRFFYGLKGQ
jgi:hypothetical protein